MGNSLESLLSLDAMVNPRSLHVAIYSRATEFALAIRQPTGVDRIAEEFLKFVGVERWRLEALDVAIKFSNHRSTIESVIERASAVVDWVPLGDVDEEEDLPPKKGKKKGSKKKK